LKRGRKKNPSGKKIAGWTLLGLGVYFALFESILIGAGAGATGIYLLTGGKK
jgi:hypothetical protein